MIVINEDLFISEKNLVQANVGTKYGKLKDIGG